MAQQVSICQEPVFLLANHPKISVDATVRGWLWDFSLCFFIFSREDVTDTPSRKKRSSSHRDEGETTETYVAQMTVFDKNR